MKKAFTILALFAVLLLTSSAYNESAADKAASQSVAPMLVIDNGNDTFSLSEMRGKYLLLTFWSSTDANSRVACNKYTTLLMHNASNDRMSHIAINFDKSKGLFNEIVKRDNLDAAAQFNVQGEVASTIKRDFHLENGFETVLIDPSGVIIAKNPGVETLMRYLSI